MYSSSTTLYLPGRWGEATTSSVGAASVTVVISWSGASAVDAPAPSAAGGGMAGRVGGARSGAPASEARLRDFSGEVFFLRGPDFFLGQSVSQRWCRQK